MSIKKLYYFFIFISFLGLTTILGCSDEKNEDEPIQTIGKEQPDLTSLPFGGPLVLRRDLGDRVPMLERLWLCGLPVDGAGNDDASDWTNADGTWDYTSKPQVEGEVKWISEFKAELDGNGKRIITGNALPDHPTGIFPIQRGTKAFEYDRNPNVISEHEVMYEFDAIPKIADEENCVFFGKLPRLINSEVNRTN